MVTVTAPPPSSGGEVARSVKWIFGIEILMLFCYLVILLFTVLRTFARRSSPLHFALTIASRLSIPIITYTISTAEDAKGSTSPLFVVSAVFLHLLYSKIIITDSGERDFFRGACRDDIGNKLFPVAEVAGLVWIGFLLLSSTDYTLRKRLKIPTCIVIGLTIIQVVLYYISLDFATSSFALGKNPKLVRSYMEKNNSYSDPSKLLVMGEEKQTIEPDKTGGYSIHLTKEEDFITLDKVLVYCNQREITITDKERINKELCISVALFKALTGQLTESPQLDDRSSCMIIETQRFVRQLLLGKDVNYESTFRVIERELAFLDDHLNSTLPFNHHLRFPVLNILLLFFLLVCCLSMIVIILIASCFIDNSSSFLHDYYKTLEHDPYAKYVPKLFYFDVLVCLFILIGPVGMEAWEILTDLSSDWVRVSLFCKQVKDFHQPKKRRHGPSWIQNALRLLCNKRGNLRCSWSKKLNQCLIPSSTKLKPIKVPEIVKQTMFTYLQENIDIPLDAEEELVDMWELESHTEKILVLHIATSLCEDDAATKSIINSDDYQVASCLSRYCGYLVKERRELIGNDEAEWVSKIVLDVAKQFGRNKDNICKEDAPSTSAKLVAYKGRELGARLVDEKVEEKRQWAMLASAWMKMVLHLAASGDGKAHISMLSHGGGEFITHVWALLYHIGTN